MASHAPIRLARECEVVVIPYGNTVVLSAGTEVTIQHATGRAYTIVTEYGYLARIAGRDADALGLQPPQEAEMPSLSAKDAGLQEQVWELLETCYDPELPVNIVDLGLVYGCEVTQLPEGGSRIDVEFTLTAPGCGMGDVLQQDISEKLRSLPGVREVHLDLVLDPPWDPSRISEAARLELGMI